MTGVDRPPTTGTAPVSIGGNGNEMRPLLLGVRRSGAVRRDGSGLDRATGDDNGLLGEGSGVERAVGDGSGLSEGNGPYEIRA